jgi:hypothetical protein
VDVDKYHLHYIDAGKTVDRSVGAGEIDRVARNLAHLAKAGRIHSVVIHVVDPVLDTRRNVTGMFIPESTAPRAGDAKRGGGGGRA